MNEIMLCPNCGSTHHEKVLISVVKNNIRTEDVPVFICLGCGIIFVDTTKTYQCPCCHQKFSKEQLIKTYSRKGDNAEYFCPSCNLINKMTKLEI